MGKDYYVADKTFNKGQKNELTLKILSFSLGKTGSGRGYQKRIRIVRFGILEIWKLLYLWVKQFFILSNHCITFATFVQE
jgi:hypothetical protein